MNHSSLHNRTENENKRLQVRIRSNSHHGTRSRKLAFVCFYMHGHLGALIFPQFLCLQPQEAPAISNESPSERDAQRMVCLVQSFTAPVNRQCINLT
jgi:hypothetical protein